MPSASAPRRQRSQPARHPNRRLRPVIAFALLAFVVGAIVGSQHGSSAASSLSLRFVKAWAHGEYASMYSDIDDASRRHISFAAFADAYRSAAGTATVVRIRSVGHPQVNAAGEASVAVAIQTRIFGTLHETFHLHVVDGGERPRISWNRSLLFPGLLSGEQLTRNITLPPRAALLARDGSTLASGEVPAAGGQLERSSPLGTAAVAVVGTVGPVPAAERAELEAQGVPGDAMVGTSGLELAFDSLLRGRPGGQLLAGGRLLASSSPVPGRPVRTSISPALQRAAVSALGSHLGGVVALKPRSGEILAVAGLGLNSVQPPGSTFKMVTVTGLLEAGIAKPNSSFPYRTFTTLDGVKLENANGEECGGSLEQAFATSCNSVFAPLGVKLGAARLVATAERFGFNHPLGVTGASESTLPAAAQIQGELALGSTAIGQGQVQASTLQMALVAATVANHGRRPQPTFTPAGSAPPTVRVMSAAVAQQVRKMMISVVRFGTGTSAAIPGVVVAGKTGTAELGTPHCETSEVTAEAANGEAKSGPEACQGGTKNPQNTDAWFATFAPATHPAVVVGVMLVRDGAGGDTAAPVAREVLQTALQAHL